MSYIQITHNEDVDLVYAVDEPNQLDMGHPESEMAWVRSTKSYYVFDGDNWKPLNSPQASNTITMSDVNTEVDILVHDMDQLESKLTMSVDSVIRTENQRFIDQHKVNDTVEQSFGALSQTLNQHSLDLSQFKNDVKSIDATLDNQGNAIAHSQRINSEIKEQVNKICEMAFETSTKITKFASEIESLKNKSNDNKLLWLAIGSVALIEIVQIIVSII